MLPLQIDNLKKHYGASVGVEDVTLNVKEGEIFGFIGPNGAGKSTTIRALLGFLKPTSGNVNVLEKCCFNQGDLTRDEIGYVPADMGYYGHMTARQFLTYAANLKERGHDRIKELSDRLELNLAVKIGKMSTGNKKKVGIICAVMSTPKVLIFDEPTAGLDPIMQQVFFDIVTEEKKRGCAILLSSHNLTEVQKICDRVGIIKRGKVISIESVEALRQKQLKNVMFTTEHTKPELNLAGIKNLVVKEKTYSFKYVGEMTDLVNLLSTLDLINLSITDTDLDTMFLHYYS